MHRPPVAALRFGALLLVAAGSVVHPPAGYVQSTDLTNSLSTSSSRWYPPLGVPLAVSATYALPHGPYRAGHRGIDLPAEPPQPVFAPASGTVTFSGIVVDRPVVSIRVDPRTVISLEPVSSELQEGTAVTRGTQIGVVDTGGHCTAECLHLGVRVDDHYTNPLRFFHPKAVLLPWPVDDAR